MTTVVTAIVSRSAPRGAKAMPGLIRATEVVQAV